MIRKSNKKSYLTEQLGLAIQRYQEAVDSFDFLAAQHLGLNRTDMKCLSVLIQRTTATASEVADAVRLTRGATTTALDRIEKAGFAVRVRDEHNRKAVNIQLTDKGRTKIMSLWGPLVAGGNKMLEKFTVEQLETILQFMSDAYALQQAHTERLTAAGKTKA